MPFGDLSNTVRVTNRAKNTVPLGSALETAQPQPETAQLQPETAQPQPEEHLKQPDICEWTRQRAAKIEEMKRKQRENPRCWRSREKKGESLSEEEEEARAAETAQPQPQPQPQPTKTPSKDKSAAAAKAKDAPPTGATANGKKPRKGKHITDSEAPHIMNAVEIKVAHPNRMLHIGTQQYGLANVEFFRPLLLQKKQNQQFARPLSSYLQHFNSGQAQSQRLVKDSPALEFLRSKIGSCVTCVTSMWEEGPEGPTGAPVKVWTKSVCFISALAPTGKTVVGQL